MTRHKVAGAARTSIWLTLGVLVSGCAATPWDFPVPTMIGNEQGVSMTGFMKGSDEEEVKRRLAERMHCPGRLKFASLKTERADSMAGVKILRYAAVMRCTPPEGP